MASARWTSDDKPGRAEICGHGRRERSDARVARIDQPVVPQMPRGKERGRLTVDLGLDRRATCCVGLLVEGTASLLSRVTLDDRQHPGQLLAAHHGNPVGGAS